MHGTVNIYKEIFLPLSLIYEEFLTPLTVNTKNTNLFSLRTFYGPKRNWKHCLCKISIIFYFCLFRMAVYTLFQNGFHFNITLSSRKLALLASLSHLKLKRIYICYSPAGRSVLGKTVPEVLSTARGRRPRAVLETEGTVFPNTDRPRPVNNVFIYF